MTLWVFLFGRYSAYTLLFATGPLVIFLIEFQPFNNWLDGTREDLVDMFIVHTLDEIQGLIDAHAQFKATLGEADKEFQSIISLIREVESFAKQYNVPGATINPYTNLTGNDIQSKWSEVRTLVPQRDETLQDELRKQQNNEALRRQFADKSNQVGPWIERQMDAVSAIGMGMLVSFRI